MRYKVRCSCNWYIKTQKQSVEPHLGMDIGLLFDRGLYFPSTSLSQLKCSLLSNILSLQIAIEFSLGQWGTLFFKVQQSLHFWGPISLEEKHCHSEVNSAHPLGKHIHTNGSTVNQWQRPTGKCTCFTVHWSCNLINIILNESFFTSSVTSLFTARLSVHHKTVLQYC